MPADSLAIMLPVTPEVKKSRQVNQTDGKHTLFTVKELNEPMNELNQTTDRPSGDKDDFQQIKGIGEKTALALYALDIYRYADLAKFTPESLVKLLQGKVRISPQRIEQDDWIGQAKMLARGQEGEAGDPHSKTDESLAENHQQYPMRKSEENWRELGDFFVSFGYAVDRGGDERFQTRAHFSQADEFKKWDGLAPDELLAWMLDQAGLSPMKDIEAQAEVGAPVGTETTFEDEVFLDLSNLWISEVKEKISINNQVHMPMLRAACGLSISGRDATELTYDRFRFVVEFYLMDYQTHRSQLVASYADQLTPNQLAYDIEQDFPTPTIGEYRLFLIAKLLLPNTPPAHLQGPVIRAVP